MAISITARKLFHADPSLALPGIVALVGSWVCILLLFGNRLQASLVNFVAVCLLMTAAALMYSAPQVSSLEDGPNLAQRINGLELADRHQPTVATYRYSAPSLVYYLHHHVERIDAAADLAKFFDRGDVLVMPRDAYEHEREQLPSDVAVLAEEQRFLRKNSSVVLLGRTTEVARETSDEVHAH